MTGPRRLALVLAALAAPLVAPPAPAQAPAPGERTAGAPAASSLGEAFFVQKHARTGRIEWFGSAVIWILLAGSATSVALIVALSMETRRQRLAPPTIITELRRAARTGDLGSARSIVAKDGSYLGQVASSVLAESDAGREAMLRALERAGEERAVERLRRIEALSVIGAVAPMIGLFGTVYGIILAFREIVTSGGAPDPVGLAAGIGTALVTTFWGLVAAIPALCAYALLRNALDARTGETMLFLEDFVNHMHAREGPAIQPQTGPPPAPGEPGVRRRAHVG